MSEWMFKIIWVPLAALVGIALFGILAVVLNGAGWNVPFRWMCIIGVLAYFADKAVNP